MVKLFFPQVVFKPVRVRPVGLSKCGPLHQLNNPRFCSTTGQHPAKLLSRIKWFWMPAGIGFALISFIQLRHVVDRERRRHAPLEEKFSQKSIPQWIVNMFQVVPTRALSRFWGAVHDIELPVSLRGSVVRLWTWGFGCSLDEAEESDPSKYQNLGAFFTRKLMQGVRTIDESSELVCPVDGRVLHFGHVVDGKLEQVKGVPYSLESFLGSDSIFSHENQDRHLFHCVLYLGPGDCHHFHSPTEWHVESRRHFPGELFSVSPWVLKGFKDVLCTNERVALCGNWKHGAFTMTAVGAYNVGSIKIHFDNELKTNQKKGKKKNFQERKFEGNIAFSRGDHIGWFAMGSAIVLVFEGPKDFAFTVKHGQKIKLGQALGTVQKKKARSL